MDRSFTGRCLCGQITYVVTGMPVIVAQCHCVTCRRLSGAGHTTGAMFAKTDVTIKGNPGEFSYVSDRGANVTRAFCTGCGSPIYGCNSLMPNHLTVTLGTMDDATGLAIDAVIFARDRPHWDEAGPDAAIHATQPDANIGT